MEQGKFITCKAPFGYELVNGTLQIKEDEAEIVRYIFNSYLNGVSRTDIAKELTDLEFATGGGKYYWTSRTVGEILSNEKHMGDSLSQKNMLQMM